MKTSIKTPILLLLMILLISGAGLLQKRLIWVQRQTGMTQTDPLKDSPPLIAFTTVALGGFRGLIADGLWIRAMRLQEEGKYFELVQLAHWITQLEPHFGEVWVFHAWNLSYNISVLFNNPEERWRWIQNGIALLRDEGLKYNPGDAEIYYELGWIFQHKIGGSTDAAHQYYKDQWAAQMQNLLGESSTKASTNRLEDISTTYQLDPKQMNNIEATYGPLDWRLPETHAIYWAQQGLPYASKSQKLNLQRMIFQSLATAFMTGTLTRDSSNGLVMRSPDPDLLPYAQKVYQQARKDFPNQASIKQSYINFLRGAMLTCYTLNRQQQAHKLFAEIKELDPTLASRNDADLFMVKQLTENAETPEELQALIADLFDQSTIWDNLGDTNQAIGYANIAGLCWSNCAHQARGHLERVPDGVQGSRF